MDLFVKALLLSSTYGFVRVHHRLQTQYNFEVLKTYDDFVHFPAIKAWGTS